MGIGRLQPWVRVRSARSRLSRLLQRNALVMSRSAAAGPEVRPDTSHGRTPWAQLGVTSHGYSRKKPGAMRQFCRVKVW